MTTRDSDLEEDPRLRGSTHRVATTPPRQILFDSTPEIFATDQGGSFTFPLTENDKHYFETSDWDELRFLCSIWHPSDNKAIDLDRAYVELRASFDPEEDHWVRLSEVEPVVPPYGSGESFDGWIVLPVLARGSAFALNGAGFAPRTRIQIRTSLYLVG